MDDQADDIDDSGADLRALIHDTIAQANWREAIRDRPEFAARLRAEWQALGMQYVCGNRACARARRCVSNLECVVETRRELRFLLMSVARRLGMNDEAIALARS
jgi:hypothetical protein